MLTKTNKQHAQLSFLQIIAEHPHSTLSDLLPMFDDLLHDQGDESPDATSIFKLLEEMRDEWMIQSHTINQRIYSGPMERISTDSIFLYIERRGLEFIETGVVPRSQYGRRGRRQEGKDAKPFSGTISSILKGRRGPTKEPNDLRDAAEKIATAIASRRGQKEFRDRLLRIYGNNCVISGPNIPDILEAAHILPYSKGGTFSNTNGLLLRADLHTLFDLGMIAVETAGLTVIVAKQLMETPYNIYHGTKIRLPSELSNRPDIRALDKHRKSAKLH